MALGIFETLDWLKKQDKRLCCRIDQVYDELSAELATKITNQQGTPSFRSDTLANLPAPGQTGRMFISTDTFAFYRDNGAGWDLIGGPGIGTVTGSGTATQVAFWNGTSVISGSSNLFWDSANNRLGIGTATPAERLDVSGSAKIDISGQTTNLWNTGDNFYDVTSNSNAFRRIRLTNTSNGISSAIGSLFYNDVNSALQLLIGSNLHATWPNKALVRSTGSALTLASSTSYIEFRVAAIPNNPGTEAARFATTTGNLLVNTTTDSGYKLDVNGTFRSTGNANVEGSVIFGASGTGQGTLAKSGTEAQFTSVGAIFIRSGASQKVVLASGGGGYRMHLTTTGQWLFGGGSGETLSGIDNNSGQGVLRLLYSTAANSQTEGARLFTSGNFGIGTTTDETSAILNVSSTTKGFLPPRMTQAQRTAIASPAVGLIVYQTDATEGFYVNTSTGWRSITMV